MRRAAIVLGLCSSLLALTRCGGASAAACDATPGNLAGTCHLPLNGQCVEFAGMGNTDATYQKNFCTGHSGNWASDLCPTTDRLGTCNLPPANGGVQCSPKAVVLIRYFAPYTASSAQEICASVAGATYTAN